MARLVLTRRPGLSANKRQVMSLTTALNARQGLTADPADLMRDPAQTSFSVVTAGTLRPMSATSHERIQRLQRLESLLPRAVTAAADCPDSMRLLQVLSAAYGESGETARR